MTILDDDRLAEPLDVEEFDPSRVYEEMTEEEMALVALLTDPSGIDQAEFLWTDDNPHPDGSVDGCFQCHPFQWPWWQNEEPRQIDQAGRDVGKSTRIHARSCAFPFIYAGQEHAITAPEGTHLDKLTDALESRIYASWFLTQMVIGGRGGIRHRPFRLMWATRARLYCMLPQRSGLGVKGCVKAGTLVLTRRGLIPIEDVAVGDDVWSHRDRWSPVQFVDDFDDETVEVRGQGTFPAVVSSEHRVYGCADESPTPGKTAVDLGGLHWRRPSDFVGDDYINFYWTTPALPSDGDPTIPIPQPEFTGTATSLDTDRAEFWWFVGRYLADGCISRGRSKAVRPDSQEWTSGRVNIYCTPGQLEDVTRPLDALSVPWTYRDRAHSSAGVLSVCSMPMVRWLMDHFGHRAEAKTVPVFMLFAPERHRRAFIEGYQSGDGSDDGHRGRQRVSSGSAAKALSVGIGMIAHSLGLYAGYSQTSVKDYVTHVRGVPLKKEPFDSFKVRVTVNGRGHQAAGRTFYKIRSVVPAGVQRVYNIVTGDHSYVADGIVHHNSHAVWLDVDEAQDVTEKTWSELPETVREEVPGHSWLAHGVSKGVIDDFYNMTQPNSGWHVHRLTSMHSPTWDEAQRAQKEKDYHGRDNPDYLRNVYGEHGPAMNRIFVLSRLQSCRDSIESSRYNREEYFKLSITDDAVAARVGGMEAVKVASDAAIAALADMLDFPRNHEKYDVTWVGMDIGLVNDPSELLVFGEYELSAQERREDARREIAVPVAGDTRFKLLTRLKLRRLPEGLQKALIMQVIRFYRPRSFAMDKTGMGAPILQGLQQLAGTSRLFVIEPPDDASDADRQAFEEERSQARNALTVIKGYNFSEKVLIDFDTEKLETLSPGAPMKDMIEKAGIKQNAKDRATDVLRGLVDNSRLLIPEDPEILNDLNAATQQSSQEPVDAYGKRRMTYGGGKFHILDGGRMFALGWSQQKIEALVAAPPTPAAPVYDLFLGPQ